MDDAIVQFIDAVDAWLRAVDAWDAEERQLVANAIPEELEGQTFKSDAVEQAAQDVLAAGRPAIAAIIARGAGAGDVALVARYAVRGDGEALCNVREMWPRVSAELEVIRASHPGNAQPAGAGQDGAQPGAPKRKRRKRASDKPRELTRPQIEAMQLYGECKGNFTEMGRRMGIDRKTAKQHYEAAAKKVGQQAVNPYPKTTTIAHDRRGQADVSEIDDARRETDSADARRFKRRG